VWSAAHDKRGNRSPIAGFISASRGPADNLPGWQLPNSEGIARSSWQHSSRAFRSCGRHVGND
jgi:hypothetical protein